MMAQSWGSAAANAAGAIGVSATALAATCAMESNCQNVGATGGGSASGAFQMINSTYAADINGAVAYDPAISGSIVSGLPGQMDPTTEAYAASYELRTDALALENGGISDPTVLQTRAVYQFGGVVGPDVAGAPRLCQYWRNHWVERCIVGCERSDYVEHGGSVAPDDYQ